MSCNVRSVMLSVRSKPCTIKIKKRIRFECLPRDHFDILMWNEEGTNRLMIVNRRRRGRRRRRGFFPIEKREEDRSDALDWKQGVNHHHHHRALSVFHEASLIKTMSGSGAHLVRPLSRIRIRVVCVPLYSYAEPIHVRRPNLRPPTRTNT